MQILEEFFTNIANAIRKRKKTTELIKAEDFAAEIESIPQSVTSTIQESKNINITSNGTTTINPDEGYDGIAKATVVTNVQPSLQAKTVSLTSTGATTIKPDSGYYGLSSVAATPKLQTKNANATSTSAVTVTPDSGYAGLNKVTVTPVTQTKSKTITSNGTTTISADSGKVGMTKVTITTNVATNPTLTPANRVKHLQEWGSGPYTITGSCVIPAKRNMIYVITCLSAGGGGTPTVTFDARTGCSYTWLSNHNVSSNINGVVGLDIVTQYWRVNNTSGSQKTTTVRSTWNENRGIIVSSINY